MTNDQALLPAAELGTKATLNMAIRDRATNQLLGWPSSLHGTRVDYQTTLWGIYTVYSAKHSGIDVRQELDDLKKHYSLIGRRSMAYCQSRSIPISFPSAYHKGTLLGMGNASFMAGYLILIGFDEISMHFKEVFMSMGPSQDSYAFRSVLHHGAMGRERYLCRDVLELHSYGTQSVAADGSLGSWPACPTSNSIFGADRTGQTVDHILRNQLGYCRCGCRDDSGAENATN